MVSLPVCACTVLSLFLCFLQFLCVVFFVSNVSLLAGTADSLALGIFAITLTSQNGTSLPINQEQQAQPTTAILRINPSFVLCSLFFSVDKFFDDFDDFAFPLGSLFFHLLAFWECALRSHQTATRPLLHTYSQRSVTYLTFQTTLFAIHSHACMSVCRVSLPFCQPVSLPGCQSVSHVALMKLCTNCHSKKCHVCKGMLRMPR